MGDFETYTVDELKDVVDHDKPEVMYSQARGWDDLAKAFDNQADLLETRLAAGRGTPAQPETGAAPKRSDWDSKAGRAYFTSMEDQRDQLRTAARRARENGVAWREIADHVHNAKLKVTFIYEEWQRTNAASKDELSKSGDIGKYREDKAREQFDRRAREAMDTSTVQIEQTYVTRLWEHDDFTPLPDIGGTDGNLDSELRSEDRRVDPPRDRDKKPDGDKPDDDEPDDDEPDDDEPDDDEPDDDEPDGDKPGWIDPLPPPDDVEPPRDDGPDLQGPMPTLPGPAPTLPTPGPLPAQPIPPVVPVLPPGGVQPPSPGGFRPVTAPRPPGVFAPSSTVRTVSPVIGARPGATGVAPTPNASTTSAVSRPVIGAPKAANAAPTSKPMGKLIGNQGVVGSKRPVKAVRAAQTRHGGSDINRGVVRGAKHNGPAAGAPVKRGKAEDQSASPEPGDGDNTFWTPPHTVPPVITNQATDDELTFHDPGPLFGRKG